MRTTIVIVRVSFRGIKLSNRFVKEGFSNLRLWAIGFAIAFNWASSTICGQSLNFTFTNLSSGIPASAFEKKYDIYSKCGNSESKCSCRPATWTDIPFVGLLEQLSRSDLILIFLLINCMPPLRGQSMAILKFALFREMRRGAPKNGDSFGKWSANLPMVKELSFSLRLDSWC